MFRIGEFSQIARVSGRLLRYYDGIGLLRPEHTDTTSGYRYYSAAQLPRLNRILALKDLGLSLDQIAQLVDDKVSTEEIRGMLMLKKAEIEQSLHEEATRLRRVESRLRQIEEQGRLGDYDVVIKPGPARPFLSVRAIFPHFSDAFAMVQEVARTVTKQVPAHAREHMIVVAHSDFDEEDLDLEIGFSLTQEIKKSIALPGRLAMAKNELPAVDTLATLARTGPGSETHLATGALGLWMEANGYTVVGPCREVFIEVPFQKPGQEDVVMEIQFPVTKAV
jgi:DNA-binding transcriptional MerR regulator